MIWRSSRFVCASPSSKIDISRDGISVIVVKCALQRFAYDRPQVGHVMICCGFRKTELLLHVFRGFPSNVGKRTIGVYSECYQGHCLSFSIKHSRNGDWLQLSTLNVAGRGILAMSVHSICLGLYLLAYLVCQRRELGNRVSNNRSPRGVGTRAPSSSSSC